MDLEKTREIALDMARAVQKELLENHYRKPHETDTKRNFADIVTDGDRAAEAIIVDMIQTHFPTHHIVGEEGGAMGAPINEAAYIWYLDPIDGTVNFANNIPLFTTSIAMTDRNMVPQVGVVMTPVYDEFFSAAVGHGAHLNGEKMQVSGEDNLRNAVLATGFSSEPESQARSLREWSAFLPETRGLRRLGSIALELAYVASGRFDGCWEWKLQPWDVLAGLLLVKEAGGIISDYDGKNDKLFNGAEIVGTSPALHADVLRVLAAVD